MDPQNTRQQEQARQDVRAAADQQSPSPGQQQGSVAGQDAIGAAVSQAQQRQQEGQAQGAQVMLCRVTRACSRRTFAQHRPGQHCLSATRCDTLMSQTLWKVHFRVCVVR